MNNMEKEYKWKVRVSCMTFNHALYIEDVMNGFCMQETDFPFVCTIIDDTSTDGEQEVIKRYLEEHFDLEDKSVVRNEETEDYTLTFARHKTNTNCYFAVLYLKYNHYSIKKTKIPYIAEWHENCKYIALCEGDDYWIVPDKLQKQIDFLEKNQDYSMCFHNAFISIEDKDKRLSKIFNESNEDYDLTFEEAIKKWHVPTASMLIRKDAYGNYPSYIKNIYSGDITLILVLCLRGRVRYLNEIMGVYRKVSGSNSVSQSIKKSFYFKQMSILYRSFLDAPELSEETKIFINKHIEHDELLYKYHIIKENKEYYKFIFPQYIKAFVEAFKYSSTNALM